MQDHSKVNKSPYVSVIIPTYNQVEYIEKALDTACRQTYTSIEVIVIDDQSIDGTRDILLELQGKYNFKYIKNSKNIGLTKSLNIALHSASGKYFALLAGDDFWTLNKIEKQVSFMEQNQDVAACSGNVITVDSKGKPLRKWSPRHLSEVTSYIFEDILQYNFTFPATAVLLRRNIVTQLGGYDERFIMEDFPLWLKLTEAGWKLACLPEIFGYYRLHPHNMHKNNGPLFKNLFQVFNEYSRYPIYKKGIRSLYARQIKFGPTLGWYFWMFCMIRGFSLNWSYFRSYAQLVKSLTRF
jgi:glycosyltransferase involved in cell wall biosynthesis